MGAQFFIWLFFASAALFCNTHADSCTDTGFVLRNLTDVDIIYACKTVPQLNIEFQMGGGPFVVSLPNLASIAGAVRISIQKKANVSVSLPSLKTAGSNLLVDAIMVDSLLYDLDLSQLKSAREVVLGGFLHYGRIGTVNINTNAKDPTSAEFDSLTVASPDSSGKLDYLNIGGIRRIGNFEAVAPGLSIGYGMGSISVVKINYLYFNFQDSSPLLVSGMSVKADLFAFFGLIKLYNVLAIYSQIRSYGLEVTSTLGSTINGVYIFGAKGQGPLLSMGNTMYFYCDSTATLGSVSIDNLRVLNNELAVFASKNSFITINGVQITVNSAKYSTQLYKCTGHGVFDASTSQCSCFLPDLFSGSSCQMRAISNEFCVMNSSLEVYNGRYGSPQNQVYSFTPDNGSHVYKLQLYILKSGFSTWVLAYDVASSTDKAFNPKGFYRSLPTTWIDSYPPTGPWVVLDSATAATSEEDVATFSSLDQDIAAADCAVYGSSFDSSTSATTQPTTSTTANASSLSIPTFSALFYFNILYTKAIVTNLDLIRVKSAILYSLTHNVQLNMTLQDVAAITVGPSSDLKLESTVYVYNLTLRNQINALVARGDVEVNINGEMLSATSFSVAGGSADYVGLILLCLAVAVLILGTMFYVRNRQGGHPSKLDEFGFGTVHYYVAAQIDKDLISFLRGQFSSFTMRSGSSEDGILSNGHVGFDTSNSIQMTTFPSSGFPSLNSPFGQNAPNSNIVAPHYIPLSNQKISSVPNVLYEPVQSQRPVDPSYISLVDQQQPMSNGLYQQPASLRDTLPDIAPIEPELGPLSPDDIKLLQTSQLLSNDDDELPDGRFPDLGIELTNESHFDFQKMPSDQGRGLNQPSLDSNSPAGQPFIVENPYNLTLDNARRLDLVQQTNDEAIPSHRWSKEMIGTFLTDLDTGNVGSIEPSNSSNSSSIRSTQFNGRPGGVDGDGNAPLRKSGMLVEETLNQVFSGPQSHDYTPLSSFSPRLVSNPTPDSQLMGSPAMLVSSPTNPSYQANALLPTPSTPGAMFTPTPPSNTPIYNYSSPSQTPNSPLPSSSYSQVPSPPPASLLTMPNGPTQGLPYAGLREHEVYYSTIPENLLLKNVSDSYIHVEGNSDSRISTTSFPPNTQMRESTQGFGNPLTTSLTLLSNSSGSPQPKVSFTGVPMHEYTTINSQTTNATLRSDPFVTLSSRGSSDPFVTLNSQTSASNPYPTSSSSQTFNTSNYPPCEDINLSDARGNTPLIWAVRLSYMHGVRILLDHGCNVDVVNYEGWSGLHYAMLDPSPVIADMLLGAHANINIADVYFKTPLHVACIIGAAAHVDLLLARDTDALHATDEARMTALMFAARDGQVEVIKRILRENMTTYDINARDEQGNTAVHWAARMNHTESLRVLLTHKQVEVRVLNEKGETALHLAVREGHLQAAELVLQHAKEPALLLRHRSVAGDRVEDIARRNHSKDLLELIQTWTASGNVSGPVISPVISTSPETQTSPQVAVPQSSPSPSPPTSSPAHRTPMPPAPPLSPVNGVGGILPLQQSSESNAAKKTKLGARNEYHKKRRLEEAHREKELQDMVDGLSTEHHSLAAALEEARMEALALQQAVQHLLHTRNASSRASYT